jgi:putative membrane protein
MREHYLGLSKAAVPFNNGTIAASERHTIASNMEMKMYMHGGWGHMMGWGGTMYGGIGMLLFWGIIIVLIVLLARGYMSGWPSRFQPRSSHSGSTALDILKERHAKGEISKEEYQECKKTLAE